MKPPFSSQDSLLQQMRRSGFFFSLHTADRILIALTGLQFMRCYEGFNSMLTVKFKTVNYVLFQL